MYSQSAPDTLFLLGHDALRVKWCILCSQSTNRELHRIRMVFVPGKVWKHWTYQFLTYWLGVCIGNAESVVSMYIWRRAAQLFFFVVWSWIILSVDWLPLIDACVHHLIADGVPFRGFPIQNYFRQRRIHRIFRTITWETVQTREFSYFWTGYAIISEISLSSLDRIRNKRS